MSILLVESLTNIKVGVKTLILQKKTDAPHFFLFEGERKFESLFETRIES